MRDHHSLQRVGRIRRERFRLGSVVAALLAVLLATSAVLAIPGPARAEQAFPVSSPTILPITTPDYMRYIQVNNFRFDPLAAKPDIPPGLAYETVPRDQQGYYIVQFNAPVRPEMKAALESTGITILYYVNYNAFVVRADGAMIERAHTFSFFRWAGVFEPAYKLSPRLSDRYEDIVTAAMERNRAVSAGGKAVSSAADLGPKVSVDRVSASPSLGASPGGRGPVSPSLGAGERTSVLGFAGGPGVPSSRVPVLILTFEKSWVPHVAQTVSLLGGSDIATAQGMYGIVRAELDRGVLIRLARNPGVMWVDRPTQPYVFNDIARWVIQSADSTNYSTPIHDHGIYGTGQVVTVGDTGIDFEHNAFEDPNVTTPGPTHRKVTAYYVPVGATGDSSDNGINHGTHVSGTVAGDDGTWHVYDGDPFGSGGAAGPHDGQAFDGTLQVQDLSPDGFFVYPPPDLHTMYQEALDQNSTFHTNSWGSCCSSYIPEAAQTDDFLWTNQQFVVLYAAGNAGPGLFSLNPFADAKNVIGVGATVNGVGMEDLAGFSSRGPAGDGRLKPDITAPGVSVWSAHGCDPGGQCDDYFTLSGTSMSTPTAAGASALIRQYYKDGWYPTGTQEPGNAFTPTGALVKATLINSAREMTGAGAYDNGETKYPNMNQGWGRILLSDALFFQGDARGLFVDDHTAGLITGDVVQYQLAIGDASQSVEVTLVWTDFAGSPFCNPCLVNDLNLVVTAPDGTAYRGNQFTGFNPGESEANPNGTDQLNNVEGVLVVANGAGAEPQSGLWTVEVSAFNVPNGPQTYAIVMTGGIAAQKGVVQMDKNRYQSSATVNIRLVDTDLNADPNATDSAVVNMTSDTETSPEAVTVTETGNATSVFAGSITLQNNPVPTPGDGFLQVQNGNNITASYLDSDDGLGGSGNTTDTAVVDDSPPVISGVGVTNVRFNRATINWATDELADSLVRYGTSVPPGLVTSDPVRVTSHSVRLTQLTESTTYFFSVQSADEAGNVAIADNGGAYFQFTTPPKPPTQAPEADWPAFHNNMARVGVSANVFAPPMTELWSDGPNLLALWTGPVYANGILYSTTLDGFIRARDPFSGEVVWQRQLGDSFFYTGVPAVRGGVVYTTFYGFAGGFVYALDAATGQTRWVRGPETGLDFNARVAMAAADGFVFGSAWAGEIFALNVTDGSIVWTYPTFDLPFGGPSVSDGRVIMGTVFSQRVHALNEFTGALLWTRVLDNWITSPPLVAQGEVYVGTLSGTMYSLDAATGEVLWQRGGLGPIWITTPAYDGSRIYLGTDSGTYYALDTVDGTVLWQTFIGPPIESSLAYVNGFLYGTAWDGNFYTLAASNGAIVDADLMSFAGSSSSPAVGNGWVWAEDADGTIYAFGAPGAGVPTSVLGTPAPANVAVASAVLIEGQAYDTYGNPVPATGFTWASLQGLGTIIPVSASGDVAIYVAGVRAGVDTVQVSVAGLTNTMVVNVLPGLLDRVVITPGTASVVAGTTMQFSADAQDRFGNSIAGATFTWGVTGGIGTISSTGLFTASTQVGVGTVTATSGGKTGIVVVTVVPDAIDHILATPASVTIEAGTTRLVIAQGYDQYNNPIPGLTYTWSTTIGTVTPTSATGEVAVLSAGTAAGIGTITTAASGKTVTVSVTVTPGPLNRIALAPAPAQVVAGGQLQFSATPMDIFGNTISGLTLVWTASPALGSMDATGLLTAATTVATGTVTVSSGGVSASASVTIVPGPLASIVASPSSLSVAAGGTVALSAVGRDQYGNAIPDAAIAWSATQGTVTSLNAEGTIVQYVAPTAAGSATLTASSGSLSQTVSVTVVAGPVAALAISPASPSVQAGKTVTLAATPTDVYGNVATVTVTWSASGGSVDATGVLTAPTTVGPVVVTASAAGRQASTTVTVTPDSLDRIVVSPTSISVKTGGGANLVVVAQDRYGNAIPDAAFTWDTTIGTIQTSPDGTSATFIAGEQGGSGTITIASGAEEATVNVVITEENLPIGRQVAQPSSLLLLVLLVLFAVLSVFLWTRNRQLKKELEEAKKGGGGGGRGAGGAGGEGEEI